MTVESPAKSGVREQQIRAPRSSGSIPSLSVLIPIAERHDDLAALYHQIVEEVTQRDIPFEVIFVLDGSGFPEAEKQLRGLQGSHLNVRVYKLNRSFGEAVALRVAAAQARGGLIMTLAPYFQLAPGGMGKLLNALDGSNDLVVAWRHPRIDSWFNRLQSRVFHFLIRGLTGLRLRDISCGLRVMKAEVLQAIPVYGDLHRFVPLLAHKKGFRIAEIPLAQSPADARTRFFGPGVYLRRLLDILTVFFIFNFTRKPLRFFGVMGAGLFGVGILITGYLATLRLLHLTALADRPLLLLGVLLMVLGIQTGSLGLIGEIIVFTNAKKNEDYVVEVILD